MRTLAKRKRLQGYFLFALGTLCYCITLLVSLFVIHNFSLLQAPIMVALSLIMVVSFIGFFILFKKSIYLFADASLLLKGADLIIRQNADDILSSTEKTIVMLANRILLKAQTNSH